jgi:hypothetical protein
MPFQWRTLFGHPYLAPGKAKQVLHADALPPECRHTNKHEDTAEHDLGHLCPQSFERLWHGLHIDAATIPASPPASKFAAPIRQSTLYTALSSLASKKSAHRHGTAQHQTNHNENTPSRPLGE